MRIINKLKTKSGMFLGIIVMFSIVVGLSYGTFIFSTGNYRSTSMLISNLLYGIDITTTGGNETINTKTVTLPSGKTSTILLKITSLNDVESKYGVSYKINSGTGSVKYSSNTGWLPTGKINKNGTGTYEKVVKIVIEATSDLSVEFNVDGGYTYNDLNSTKDGYTRVTEMYEGITDYTESLKTIIENETSNNIYGGEAINNYLQYPEDTDTTKNIWRIIGYYETVSGIKIIANPVKETSTTNISTELTTFYNTLTKKSDYVLETNKFSCTGLNCTTSTYSNIGLLNTSEYSYIGGINSYLNENNYYVMDGTTIKNITSGNITEASTTSNLRPVIYLQSDVKVKGSGTITNPYKLSEKGDVVFASATLNGTSISFPKESDPYIPKTVTCTNGSVGEWNTEKQKIILTTVNLPTSCVVDFTEGYTVTLNVINGSTSPVSKVVGRDGVTSFTVTPNDGYKLELESDTCNGTLSGNTYTISNIISNKTCTITFKKNGIVLSSLIKSYATSHTNGVYNENGYRYEGTDPNNYIYMTNKSTNEKELWRIIGVFNDGANGEEVIRVRRHYEKNNYPTSAYDTSGSTAYNYKNIKESKKSLLAFNDASSEKYIAAGDLVLCPNCKNHWPISSLYTKLKEIYSTTYYKYTVDFTIYLGGEHLYNVPYIPSELYDMERMLNGKGKPGATSKASYSSITTFIGRVGLMYPSDYAYAANASDCERTLTNLKYMNISACHNNNWLFQGQNQSQWLISPSAYHTYSSVLIMGDGSFYDSGPGGGSTQVVGTFAYSPVMALKSDVKVTGSGTQSDPYVMN